MSKVQIMSKLKESKFTGACNIIKYGWIEEK